MLFISIEYFFHFIIPFQKLESIIVNRMNPTPNKSPINSRQSQRNSCSSLSSFADETPQKRKKTDRMVYSIDKSQFDWSEKKTVKKSHKNQNNQDQSSENKFQDYLSDHLSEDSSSIQQFLGKNLKRSKQWNLKKRKISDEPFKRAKILKWRDNFYTNLLQWNHDNIIFAAADQQIFHYTLNSFDQRKFQVYVWPWIRGVRINAIKCSPIQKLTAAAYQSGALQVYDYFKQKSLKLDIVHTGRITALDWSEHSILTGSKDQTIKTCDDRTFKECYRFQQVHFQEVLGIKKCGNLVASGGNDNLVAIFDIRKSQKMLCSYEHYAAVKSLAWIEEQKILISGGGTSDKYIKFWNHKKMEIVKEIQTGSQVCNLVVSKNTKQFVSCQGFSQNQIVLWDWQANKLNILHGKHSARVLYSVLSPQGQYLATGAGDGNLFIWKMFPGQRKNRMIEASDLR